MSTENVIELTKNLIKFRSISGEEAEVAQFLEADLQARGWKVQRLHMPDGRYNLAVFFGTPRILFTTHLDVVGGPAHIFSPCWDGEKLTGRGACDAKGIAATMIECAVALTVKGASNFGLLFVLSEETDGSGAKCAGDLLKNSGISYIVNGEPTENMLVSASKGVISGSISFTGKSSHSGYPELGEDANAKLLRTATKLLALELGSDPALGIGTINIGYINGGIASNVVSESAELKFSIRTVKDTQSIYHEIEGIVKVEQGLARIGVLEPLILKTVPDFKTCIVSYACDIPHFLPIGAEALMYGPGSITRAHTDFEYIIAAEIEEALEGYQKIYWKLTDLL